MAIANLTLRFILELAGIAAFGIWGLAVSSSPIVAVGAVAVAIVVWALVVAPKTRNGLSQPQKDVVGTAILLVAAVALAAAGNPVAGVVFGLVVVVNAAILAALGPGARDAFGPNGCPGRLASTDRQGVRHATRTRPAPARRRPRQQLPRRGGRRDHRRRRRDVRPVRRPRARARGDGPVEGRHPGDRADPRRHRPRRIRRPPPPGARHPGLRAGRRRRPRTRRGQEAGQRLGADEARTVPRVHGLWPAQGGPAHQAGHGADARRGRRDARPAGIAARDPAAGAHAGQHGRVTCRRSARCSSATR